MLFHIRQRKMEPEGKRKKGSRDSLHLSKTSVNFLGFQVLSFIPISFWNGQILFVKNYAQNLVSCIIPDCCLEIWRKLYLKDSTCQTVTLARYLKYWLVSQTPGIFLGAVNDITAVTLTSASGSVVGGFIFSQRRFSVGTRLTPTQGYRKRGLDFGLPS